MLGFRGLGKFRVLGFMCFFSVQGVRIWARQFGYRLQWLVPPAASIRALTG